MFVYAAILVSLIGLAIATYTDLKERIVPNKLNYGLAIIGLIIFGIQSIVVESPLPFIYSVLGLSVGFLFGWVLWKLGVFAGGDVKLFMALGALNPFTPALFKVGYFSASALTIFPLSLFIASLIAFLPYGLFFALYKLIHNKKYLREVLIKAKARTIEGVHTSLFSGASYVIVITAHITPLILIPALIVWGLMGPYKKFATIITLIIGLFLNAFLTLQSAASAAAIIIFFYGSIQLLLSLRPLLSTKIKTTKAVEGMIVGTALVWKGKKLVSVEGLTLSQIFAAVKKQNLNVLLAHMQSPKNLFASPNKACGLSDEEAHTLRALAKKGMAPSELTIKESMPFVPTMLIGYILCIILGDVFIRLLIGGLV